jgi:hypothetical protein
MWRIIRICILFLLSIGLLQLTYPWRIYFGNFSFGAPITLFSYFIVALLMTLIGGMLAPWIAKKSVSTDFGRISVGVIACLFLLLVLTGIFCGPGLCLDIPGTRVQGIFFSEFKFLNFIFCVALPFSFLVGLIRAIENWQLKRSR